MRIVSVLKDSRVECFSVMTEMSVADYLEFVDKAYSDRGGIDHQREQLRTTTALRIRKRMAEDFLAGAVLPPVVVGLVVVPAALAKIRRSARGVEEILLDVDPDEISIIDGMQRTTAIKEVCKENSDIHDRTVRVEFWVSSKTNSLIYRMLVLNSGQVPWNLRRQVEVVFRGVLAEIKKNVTSIEVIELADNRRRKRGGQFQADDVIELFLVFGARKEKIDTKERLADEFSRLDFIEVTADANFTTHFFGVLTLLAEIDCVFDRLTTPTGDGRFKIGRDIFSSQPASVGFVTALAIEILGRPGSRPKSTGEQEVKWKKLKREADALVTKMTRMSKADLGRYLDLDTLNVSLSSKRAGKIGEFEREFFLKAFQVLIDEGFSPESFTECWRAY